MPMCSRRASRYAPVPHSTHERSAVRLVPSTMLPVSQMIGAAKKALPIRFSEYASVFAYG